MAHQYSAPIRDQEITLLILQAAAHTIHTILSVYAGPTLLYHCMLMLKILCLYTVMRRQLQMRWEGGIYEHAHTRSHEVCV